MRTSDICPTCSTYSNALCTLYNGEYLRTLDIQPLDSIEAALIKIETFATSVGGGGGPTSFIALLDTPSSYTSQAGKYLRVNQAGDGVSFEDFAFTDEVDFTGHSVGSTPNTSVGTGETTIDWTTGNYYNFKFGAFSETFIFTPPTVPGTFILKLEQDSIGGRIASFPANVKWQGGTAPSLSTTPNTGTDIITFYYDGVSYFGVYSLNFS